RGGSARIGGCHRESRTGVGLRQFASASSVTEPGVDESVEAHGTSSNGEVGQLERFGHGRDEPTDCLLNLVLILGCSGDEVCATPHEREKRLLCVLGRMWERLCLERRESWAEGGLRDIGFCSC